MKKNSVIQKTSSIATFLIFFAGTIISAQTSNNIKTILQKTDQNRIVGEIKTEGTIIIKDKYGTRTSEIITYSKGRNYTLIEFTSAAERGQKTLRINDKIYLYYPDAEQVVTLNKSMFQQSMMNSDISYEDMAGDKSLEELFTGKIEDEQTINGHKTYRIYLSAKNERKTTYPYQRIWVRKDIFTIQKAEYFTRKKKLRKTLSVNDITKIGNIYYPTDITIIDVLKKNSSTSVKTKNISLEKLQNNIFSVEMLRF